MVSLKVLKVEKIEIQAENETKLDITIELSEDGTVLEERKLNFPLDTTKDQIKEELQNFLNTYNLERAQAAENAARDAAHAQADEVIADLTDFELTTEDNSTEPVENATTEEVSPVVENVAEVVNDTEDSVEKVTE